MRWPPLHARATARGGWIRAWWLATRRTCPRRAAREGRAGAPPGAGRLLLCRRPAAAAATSGTCQDSPGAFDDSVLVVCGSQTAGAACVQQRGQGAEPNPQKATGSGHPRRLARWGACRALVAAGAGVKQHAPPRGRPPTRPHPLTALICSPRGYTWAPRGGQNESNRGGPQCPHPLHAPLLYIPSMPATHPPHHPCTHRAAGAASQSGDDTPPPATHSRGWHRARLGQGLGGLDWQTVATNARPRATRASH